MLQWTCHDCHVLYLCLFLINCITVLCGRLLHVWEKFFFTSVALLIIVPSAYFHLRYLFVYVFKVAINMFNTELACVSVERKKQIKPLKAQWFPPCGISVDRGRFWIREPRSIMREDEQLIVWWATITAWVFHCWCQQTFNQTWNQEERQRLQRQRMLCEAGLGTWTCHIRVPPTGNGDLSLGQKQCNLSF